MESQPGHSALKCNDDTSDNEFVVHSGEEVEMTTADEEEDDQEPNNKNSGKRKEVVADTGRCVSVSNYSHDQLSFFLNFLEVGWAWGYYFIQTIEF